MLVAKMSMAKTLTAKVRRIPMNNCNYIGIGCATYTVQSDAMAALLHLESRK